MGEEQKKQVETIMSQMNLLPASQREAALAYMQGMTAATKLLGNDAEASEAKNAAMQK